MKIHYKVRNQHIYVPGKTRHGKSTLFHEMALQDIENGAGVCVIDPKGDLVNSLIHHIPEARKDDCIYLSTRDPIPINFTDYTTDDEKQTLVGDLKYVITKGLAADAAPLMDAIITDLLYTLFSANENSKMPVAQQATFLDVHRFLSDQERRDFILSYVTDLELKRRWGKESFPNAKECAPTLTRMTPFLRNPSLRKLFDCPEPRFNLTDAMNGRKILLVDLGGISEPTRIFATLLIAKIRQAAFRRAHIPESDRIPFHLYVDEFEFFQTSDFDQILSFAGGYGLRLTLANQFIGQLDANIRQSIFGNVGSFIVFCVSPDDARFYRHITPEDVSLANLPKYWALYKIAGKDPVVKPTPKPSPAPTIEQIANAQLIKKRTIEMYACTTAPQPLRSGVGDPAASDHTTKPPEPKPTRRPGASPHQRPDRRP